MKLRTIACLILVLALSLVFASCELLFGTTPEVEKYEVSFSTDGGTEIEPQTVEKGGLVEEPDDPKKEGFFFRGWYRGGKKWDFDSDTVNTDITLVAKWEEIPAEHVHVEVKDEAKAPTCTEAGLTEGSHCSDCDEVLVAQNTVPALGHSYTSEVVEPNCVAGGYTKHTCSRCSDVYTDSKTAALGHTAGAAATCTAPQVCSVCSTLLSPALGHTEITDAAIEPDCTNTGLSEGSHCSTCGETIAPQTVIPALGHNEVIDEAVKPDCTNTGLTEGKHCSVCGETLVVQNTVPAKGHTASESEYKAPTCTESGWSDGTTCSVCGEVLKAQVEIPALGHTEQIIPAVEADCENTGLTEGKKCSVCGEILVAQVVAPAKGHTEEILSAKAPTCTDSGLTEGKKCSVCGEILVAQTEIPSTGVHSYVNGECTVCGDVKDGWVKITYVLHYGVNDERNIELYLKGDYPTLYDPTREGYIFKGWYDSTTYNNKITTLEGVDESTTLYALWEKGNTGGSGSGGTTTPEVPI